MVQDQGEPSEGEEMQDLEGRYVVQAFDEYTWSILDTFTAQAYVLGLTRLDNLIVQISLAEVAVNAESSRFMMYLREILVCNVQVSEMSVAHGLVSYIMVELQQGADIANPIEIAVRLGADLHGQPVEWETERAH